MMRPSVRKMVKLFGVGLAAVFTVLASPAGANGVTPLVCGDTKSYIHDVQGSGDASPMTGSTVTVEGVVVGAFQGGSASYLRGFFLQEPDASADANPATSEGIWVHDGSPFVAVSRGDVVRVRGTVVEYPSAPGLTEIDVGTLGAVQVCPPGATVTPAEITLPLASLADLERYEGMLVHFAQPLTVTEVYDLYRYGEIGLSVAGRLYVPTAVALPGAPALALADLNERSRILLDDGSNRQNSDPSRYPQDGLSASNTLRVGDTLPDGLTGVLDYRSGGYPSYRIQPVGPIEFVHANPRPAAPEPVGGNLKVASFSAYKYFNGDGMGGGFSNSYGGASNAIEFMRQTAKIVSALDGLGADIVGLTDVENDPTPNSAIESLVAALNAAAGPGTYAFVDTGVIGAQPIRVALIYKPAVVTPVGPWKIMDSTVDARFDDSMNRPSLAQTFALNANGERLTVVVQHLRSKGNPCDAANDPDTGDGQGNCNLTRLNAVKALVDWLATDPTGSVDPDFLLIGDFNSYNQEDPIRWFTTHGYANLVPKFRGLDAYTYVFDGESGSLYHALASTSLAYQASGATPWQVNADEPPALDYNMEYKSTEQINSLYANDAYRSSDHDPILVGLGLVPPPRVLVDRVRAQLDALAVGMDKREADKLGKIEKELVQALDPKKWLDDAHLVTRGGETVFDRVKDAVKDLVALAKDRKSAVPAATLQAMVADLVGAAAALANAAVDDAIASGGPAKTIARAREELAKGSAAREAGDFDGAVAHYKAAWQQAQEAIKKA